VRKEDADACQAQSCCNHLDHRKRSIAPHEGEASFTSQEEIWSTLGYGPIVRVVRRLMPWYDCAIAKEQVIARE
jgi:hypothetical protein